MTGRTVLLVVVPLALAFGGVGYASSATAAGSFQVSGAGVAGDPTVGHTLRAIHGTWTPKPKKFKYKWYRLLGEGHVSHIDGANSSTYKLQVKDLGKKIIVRIKGFKPGTGSQSIYVQTTEKVVLGGSGGGGSGGSGGDTTPPPVATNLHSSDTTGFAKNELAWDAVSASDLAGYNVYDSTDGGGTWTKLTPSPITATAFTVPPGPTNAVTSHLAAVTSVDTHGNESARSGTFAFNCGFGFCV